MIDMHAHWRPAVLADAAAMLAPARTDRAARTGRGWGAFDECSHVATVGHGPGLPTSGAVWKTSAT